MKYLQLFIQLRLIVSFILEVNGSNEDCIIISDEEHQVSLGGNVIFINVKNLAFYVLLKLIIFNPNVVILPILLN